MDTFITGEAGVIPGVNMVICHLSTKNVIKYVVIVNTFDDTSF